MRFLCWFIGHNKVLELKKEDGLTNYYDLCTQCHKSWLNKSLSDVPKKPEIKIEKKPMKIIVKPNLKKIHQKQMLLKAKANFYVL